MNQSIITKQDVNNALYSYKVSCTQLLQAVEHNNVLINELKGVKIRCPLKTYQSYKAVTTELRRNQIEVIKDCFQNRHEKYQEYDKLRKLEIEQNRQSNKQQLLENTLKKLSYEELHILKEYLNIKK